MSIGIWRTIYLFRTEYWKIHNLFSSNKKEVTRIDKKGKEITKPISYRWQFIESARFMTGPLSNLPNNFVKWIQKIKWKYKHCDKKCETWGIKYKDCECFFEYTNLNIQRWFNRTPMFLLQQELV